MNTAPKLRGRLPKLTVLSLLIVSCGSAFVALLLSGGPGGLPIVPAFIVPGARQLVATSSHPLVRFFSEPQIAAVTHGDCDIEPKAYVTNLRSNSVSVIDVSTDTVVATIPVGQNPFAIAITPDCSKAYVGNFGNRFTPENTVSVIDVENDEVIATLTVGLNPGAVAISPDGSKVYVANSGFSGSDNTVSVIDVKTDRVIDVNPGTANVIDPIIVGLNPGAIAMTPDSSRAYVTNSLSGTVSVIDTSTDEVIATIPVGFEPAGIAITSDGSKAYVANHISDSVSVIDTQENIVTREINVGTEPLVAAISPDDSKVYVTNTNPTNPSGNSVSVIDVSRDEVSATIPVGNIPIAIGFTPNGSKAYVSNCNCGIANPTAPDTVSAIDVDTDTEIKKITVGLGPLGLAVAADGSKVYVPNSNSSTVSVIDTREDKVTATIPVGSGPAEIVISPDDSRVYVSNFNNPDSPGSTVTVIDTITNTPIGEIMAGLGPAGLAITPDGSKLYVANFGRIMQPGNTVSVIDLATEEPIKEIIVGTGPIDVAVTATGKAYVSNFGGGNSTGNTITVIETSTDSVIGTVNVGNGPAGLTATPDGSRVFVANLGSVENPPNSQSGNTVSIIDTATDAAVGEVTVGTGPLDIAITPDGSQAFVSNFGVIRNQIDFDAGNTLSVISVLSGSVVATVPLSSVCPVGFACGPSGVAITPDSSRVYVNNLDKVSKVILDLISLSDPGDSVLLIDGDTPLGASVGVGKRPFGIAITHDGNRAYIANYFSNTVSAIDLSSNSVVATIPIR